MNCWKFCSLPKFCVNQLFEFGGWNVFVSANANIVTCEPSLRNILLPLHRFVKHFAMALWQTEAY